MPTKNDPAHSADGPNAWRSVIAALANPESRRVLGLLLADADATDHLASLSGARRERVERVLTHAGLLDTSAGAPRLRVERFAELLAATSVERPTGLDRFIVDGRLDQYPAGSDDRAAVHAYVVDRVMPDPDERVDELTLTERLAVLTKDPVTMRRYLVDAGLVEREPDGSVYRRAAGSGYSPLSRVAT